MKKKKIKVKDILVVGVGIVGCETALELADAGFNVFLMEKNPPINGTSKLSDKNLPTYDCEYCLLAPKLVGQDKHPNIKLMTNADIIKLEGKPGKFKASIKKRKNKVERVQQCPSQIPDKFIDILKDKKIGYLEFPQTEPLKLLIKKRKIPPCENACPAHVKSQEYVDLIRKGKYQEALDLIRERCPLPSVIGRVCPHPCEEVCNRREVDEPINICGLKMFVADYVRNNLDEKIMFLEDKKEKKVAVVGSGPSGLTVAYHLARRGYLVTIFERESVAGGMLRLGIPNYRLPPNILNADIQHIKNYGVKIKTNSPIGPPGPTIKNLLKNYDAVYIGVGLPVSRKLNIEGEDLDNIVYGIDFLKKCSLGEEFTVGKNVLVIGGGDVAVDVARTAVRKGANEVQMVMLESEDIIPAHPWEVEEAKEEGIIFHVSRGPKRFIGENGKVIGLETLFCSSVFDDEGRFSPVLETCSEKIIDADMVIVTIGQTSDLAFLDKDIKVGRGIEINRKNFQTSIAGVFAGGEIVTGPGAAINAIAMGNKAAIVIDRYLKGDDISTISETIPDYKDDEIVTIDDILGLDRIEHKARKNNKFILPKERIKNFKEFTLGMEENEAIEEAERCLSCGICTECFEYVKSCVADVIANEEIDEKIEDLITINIGAVILSPGAWLSCFALRRGTDYRWEIINPIAEVNEEKCIGCGSCVEICPFNAISIKITQMQLVEYVIDQRQAKIDPIQCKGCGKCVPRCPVQAISQKHITKEQVERAMLS